MHDWFYEIELFESIWQKKAELRETSLSLSNCLLTDYPFWNSPDIGIIVSNIMFTSSTIAALQVITEDALGLILDEF